MGNCEETCETKHSSGCEMTDMMMQLADDAWMELMKEKIKKEMEKQLSEKMNKIAKVATDASIANHMHMMQAKQKTEEHKNIMKKAFMS